MRMNPKLIIGLGNPGTKYAKTRHNVGFMAVDAIARDHQTKFSQNKKTECEIVKIGEIILAKPDSFMNNSGRALAKLVNYFKVGLGDILVIYDDVDLPVGIVRFRKEGGSAGHKGMQSIIDTLKTDQMKRIRIGVGKSDTVETDKYVLQPFPSVELKKIKTAIDEAAKLAVSKL